MDRLDRVLNSVQDMAATSRRQISSNPEAGQSSDPSISSRLRKRCRSIESLLEEVEQKGSLVERMARLEKSISKLGKSSSNIVPTGSDVLIRPLVLSPPAPPKAENIHEASSRELLAIEEKHELLPGELEQFQADIFGHVAEFELILKDASQHLEEKRAEDTIKLRGRTSTSHSINEAAAPAVNQFDKDVASQKHSKKKTKRLSQWLKSYCTFPCHQNT